MTLTIPQNLALIAGGLATLVACQIIVVTSDLHGHHTMDSTSGVQKVHEHPTPRIGGIAVALGLLVSWVMIPQPLRHLLGPLLVASIPAFISGLVEDLSKRGAVSERLLATIASGAIAWLLTGVSLRGVDIYGVNWLLSFTAVSVLFTAIAVGGVANSINIIDGLNGLAGGVVMLCLAALGYIAYSAGDNDLAKLCFIIGCITMGFMLVNYPLGKIFLGDGGAYLLGFLLGWIAVMLSARNPSVSPWAPLLACGYPIIEVIFSMLRRSVRTKQIGHPDRLHLHTLVWARVTKKHLSARPPVVQNAATLPFILAYAAIPAGLSVLFKTNTLALMLSLLFCVILYTCIYFRLVKFRWAMPKFK